MRKTRSIPKTCRENRCLVAYFNMRNFLCPLATARTWRLVLFAVLLGLSNAANATAPSVTTGAATGVTATGATLNGTVNPSNRNITSDGFDYGPTTGYGSNINGTPYTVTAGSGNIAISASLTGLTCNTTYHYRVWAHNSSGTTNGLDGNFTTSACPATVTSINLASASPSNAASVQWTVTFGQSETGVSASDFSLVVTGLGGTPAITSVTGSGTTWTVTASTGTGSGTLGLDATSATGMSPVVTGLPFTGQVYTIDRVAPTVTSINYASPNPTSAANVSWTVTFSKSVTGVSASNFSLAITGLGGPPVITAVTGSGTTWTVTASTGSGSGSLGLNQTSTAGVSDTAGNALTGTFTGQVYTVQAFCSPPSDIPAGVSVSCVCDTFGRASLNPSTIYGANWIVSTSDATGVVPYINNTTGLLRLTENTGNNAKAATVPGIFPAAGNYISVEFQHYAYNGSGADGIAVTLSDYSVPAVPGAFGGSLGYAQKTGAACPSPPCNGFAGGWIGVALDEFGNYQNPTEGRIGGPGPVPESVGVRGSGSGTSGYNYLSGTATLSPIIDNRTSTTPSPGYYYQVIVDARTDPVNTTITVNRDTTGTGTSYTQQLINIPDVYAAANAQGFTQAPVPSNWQISFTGSTGGSTNIHEIGGLRICAQTVAPPSGGTPSGFNAIDEAYATLPATPAVQNFLSGHVYMKLLGTSFKLWLAAINNNQILTTYAASANKNVTVNLVDNSDGGCVLDSSQPNYCSATCRAKPAVAGGSQTVTFASANHGMNETASFTLNSAYKDLAAIISDGTTTACSTDAFSVRPTSFTSVTSSNATNTTTTGAPSFKAGTDNFSLTATAAGIGTNPGGYTGVPQINSASVQAFTPATFLGTLAGTFPAAISGTGDSTATGTTFTYSEVGTFQIRGPAFAMPPGVYDATWTAVDSGSSKNDCISGTTAAAYSNTKDANGKYGCNFGITADTGGFGRFTPDHFDVTAVTPGCLSGAFTYAGLMPVGPQPSVPGQPFSVTATARNAGGQTTLNYDKTTGFAQDTTISDAGNATNFTGNPLAAAGYTQGVGSATITYRFAAKESPPQTLTLRAIDTDNISSAGHVEPTTLVESGRVRIQNVYGSELAAMPMPMRAEYYTGTANGWMTNTTDTCTSLALNSLSLSNNVLPSPVSGTTAKVVNGTLTTSASIANAPFVAGDAGLSLSAPGPGGTGYVDVTASLAAMTWLQYDWDGNGVADNNPQGRATFGLYRGSPRQIYLRERY